MKKLLIAAAIALALPTAALAAPYKLPKTYRAVYCYPTGSYWSAQTAAYPEYYMQYDSYFAAAYGPSTMYCPVN